jgi:cytochrome b
MNRDTEINVWDPLVRGFHWLLVAAFFIAYFTEDDWLDIHVWAGYLIVALLAVRLVWGFVGPRYARFSDFVRPPKAALVYTQQVLKGRAKRYIGHNPAGGAMIVLLLISLLITTFTGMAYYGGDAWLGPLAGLMKNADDDTLHLLEELHEFFANFTLALVGLHVLGVIWESVLHQENLVRSMLTGRKRIPTDEHIS